MFGSVRIYSDRRIGSIDDVASAILGQGDILVARDGRLGGANSTSQCALDRALALFRPYRVLLASDQDQCLVCIEPTPDASGWLIRIRRVRVEELPRVVDLSSVFDLTKAETRILYNLLSGDSELEVATRLRVSEETVRTHRKRLYSKLGVKGRADMILLLWKLSSL